MGYMTTPYRNGDRFSTKGEQVNFISAMRSEFGRAQRLALSSLCTKFGIGVLGVLAVVSPSEISSRIIIGLSALGQVVLFLLRWKSDELQNTGNQLRLAALLENGLGVRPSPTEVAIFKSRVGDYGEKADTSAYYASKLGQGQDRLVDIVSESAYFTENIARLSAYIFYVAICVAVVILVITFVALVFVPIPQTSLQIAAKVFIIAVVFWIADDVIVLAIRYRALETACHEIVIASDTYFKVGELHRREDAFAILTRYHSATAAAPPFPVGLYRRRHDELNANWAPVVASRSIASR